MTREVVAEAIATVHPAIEIVESRFAAGLDAPDLDRVADLRSCGGVILGGDTQEPEVAVTVTPSSES